MAKVEKEKRNFICTDDGRTAVEKLSTETACFANQTAIGELQTNRNNCKATHGLNTMTTTDCTKINNTRNCDRNYAASKCGDYTEFIIDGSWLSRIKIEWNSCYDDAKKSKKTLPSSG
ncbi:hypothetical protein PoB_005545600 [Plakobranchus ocellatus]|uniref:Uncharacterized protein n=1 Tax=Plakobranchus ocellatus TaxID=259542 RepID=A0AAV4CC70_9GAST|nr:hypothetical protein PoB_005545600 [Plakobranchus ocellatus]